MVPSLRNPVRGDLYFKTGAQLFEDTSIKIKWYDAP